MKKSRTSSPKHRHDGTSPLPMGMDWSPTPRRWDGKYTVWPHNPQTGWSYCVFIPSWTVQSEPGTSHDNFLKTVVFYRIHVGIQSPEGLSSSHGVLRRFNDFLRLYSDLKKAFPRKDIPPAPPKHSLLRINSSRLLLEERRRTLEEWMGKLLSDIDISRSAPVAGFLELEAAVRSSFQDHNQHASEVSSSSEAAAFPSLVATARSNSTGSFTGSSTEDISLVSDSGIRYSSGNALVGYDSNVHPNKENHFQDRETDDGNDPAYRLSALEQESDILLGHARRNSSESIGSEASSLRGSELSAQGLTSSMWDGSTDHPSRAKASNSIQVLNGTGEIFLNDGDVPIILPLDQRHKLSRLLVTMQRRLATAKTDMEDLIARLNQEMAVKEYLSTKVKDLEVELEVTKQKGKETLQQAILVERERITQMQWDMDELCRKYSDMESVLKCEQNEKYRIEAENSTASEDKQLLLHELDVKNEELKSIQKHLEEVEAKSKTDIKLLVKEVKSLRNSQTEIKKVCNQYFEEKTELQRVLHVERERLAQANLARRKLLHECKVLQDRLRECGVNILMEEDNKLTVDPSSVPGAFDVLATSDNRIGLLLAEAQLLAQDDEQSVPYANNIVNSNFIDAAANPEDPTATDEETRNLLSDMFIENAQLRKRLNSITRCAVNTMVKLEEGHIEEHNPIKSVRSRFL